LKRNPNPDIENETHLPVCHCEVVTTVAIRRSRCEGETRGNLNEIPRSARNDTSCQIASFPSQRQFPKSEFGRKVSNVNPVRNSSWALFLTG
jgi:hypothetical protein